MVSTVKSRPNHYEVLGLKPSATAEEIEQAFAWEISAFRPRAFGGLAEVSLAHEVLRDPIRRRDYDIALGLVPKPRPRPPMPALHFSGSAHWDALVRPAPDPVPPSTPRAPSAVSEPVAEAPPAVPEAFAEASTQPPEPSVQPEIAEQEEPKSVQELGIPDFLTLRRPIAEPAGELDEERLPEWKRPALAAGALLAGAALFGTWAGMSAGNSAQDAKAITVELPKARAEPMAAAAMPEAAAGLFDLSSAKASHARLASARAGRAHSPRQAERAGEGLAESGLSSAIDLEQNGGEQSAPQAAVVPASMPLPNHVIAATLHRIGYGCGRVASVAAAESGAPGAYKVTCTSGQSYHASPVGGRYRFRRL